MAFNFSPKIVTNGLVLYLDAANPRSYVSGSTVWNDLSRNGNNGTLTNGPTYDTTNGGSIVFDGINDFVATTLNNTPTLNLTNQVTLECWFKPKTLANASQGQGLISKGVGPDTFSGIYEIILVPSGGLNYIFFRIVFSSIGAIFYLPTNIPINLNQNYHVICTYNGSIMRIFVNGVESGTGNAASDSILSNTQQLSIGARYIHSIGGSLNNSYFNGNLYNVRIYNRALTASEILQNYNATKTRFGL